MRWEKAGLTIVPCISKPEGANWQGIDLSYSHPDSNPFVLMQLENNSGRVGYIQDALKKDSVKVYLSNICI